MDRGINQFPLIQVLADIDGAGPGVIEINLNRLAGLRHRIQEILEIAKERALVQSVEAFFQGAVLAFIHRGTQLL